MKMQNTSLEAYEYIKKELGFRQKQVYEALKILGEADNLTISKYLNLPINSITPRVNELRGKKLVGVSREGISKHTGKRVIFWRVVR